MLMLALSTAWTFSAHPPKQEFFKGIFSENTLLMGGFLQQLCFSRHITQHHADIT
jgi:hypothetical protein